MSEFVCPHERKVLVEGGYEREWEWSAVWSPAEAGEPDGVVYYASDYYPNGFSDDGDGDYVLRCKTCLKELPLPDEWEWS